MNGYIYSVFLTPKKFYDGTSVINENSNPELCSERMLGIKLSPENKMLFSGCNFRVVRV
ncbi:MAG: hypothetical protein LBH59_09790 [Planctomycetaceae bacterium]|nr:hypothetical protein [Planctomycetaceae bacterium]